jgi:hypothetical protein
MVCWFGQRGGAREAACRLPPGKGLEIPSSWSAPTRNYEAGVPTVAPRYASRLFVGPLRPNTVAYWGRQEGVAMRPPRSSPAIKPRAVPVGLRLH